MKGTLWAWDVKDKRKSREREEYISENNPLVLPWISLSNPETGPCCRHHRFVKLLRPQVAGDETYLVHNSTHGP